MKLPWEPCCRPVCPRYCWVHAGRHPSGTRGSRQDAAEAVTYTLPTVAGQANTRDAFPTSERDTPLSTGQGDVCTGPGGQAGPLHSDATGSQPWSTAYTQGWALGAL